MLLAILRIEQFFLSATPFCCGDLGTVRGRRIPFSSQNSLNSFDVNSPPLSDLKALISWPLLFYKCLKFLKCTKCFRFLLQKINPCFSTQIINKEKKVVTFTKWWWLDRSTHISMNKLQWLGCSCTSFFWKAFPWLLAKETSFTKLVRMLSGRQSSHHHRLCQQL